MEKWGLKIDKCTYAVWKVQVQISQKNFGEGSAGVVEKWVVKIKNAPVLCEKCKS